MLFGFLAGVLVSLSTLGWWGSFGERTSPPTGSVAGPTVEVCGVVVVACECRGEDPIESR